VNEAVRVQWLEHWKTRARGFERELYALYFAIKDERTPWYAKAAAFCVVAYALSPVDLIPDAIPVLGYLDDLIVVPLGIMIVRRLIPPMVLAECRERAQARLEDRRAARLGWLGMAVVVIVWIILFVLLVYFLRRCFLERT
jgi:uncharacterized membrane protein YkvA (DUF1232 family)